MKLNYCERIRQRKSDTSRLRKEGVIPAVIYSSGKGSSSISVIESDYTALLRTVKPGHLSTQVFELTDGAGVARRAILKDIQYHPTNYQIIHLDFEELIKDHKVNVKVPIEWINVADCVGVKLGFVLRAVIRSIRVSCLPDDIPVAFQLDVKELGPRDSKRLKDLDIPNNVRPLQSLEEVAVVVAKR
jgi:large subunit ribosomal protein L25